MEQYTLCGMLSPCGESRVEGRRCNELFGQPFDQFNGGGGFCITGSNYQGSRRCRIWSITEKFCKRASQFNGYGSC